MLTITQEAANLLVSERASSGAPDSYGIRFFAAMPEEGGGEPQLAIAFVPEAAPGDQVTEQEGVTAYVAQEVAAALEDVTIDAAAPDGSPELVLLR